MSQIQICAGLLTNIGWDAGKGSGFGIAQSGATLTGVPDVATAALRRQIDAGSCFANQRPRSLEAVFRKTIRRFDHHAAGAQQAIPCNPEGVAAGAALNALGGQFLALLVWVWNCIACKKAFQSDLHLLRRKSELVIGHLRLGRFLGRHAISAVASQLAGSHRREHVGSCLNSKTVILGKLIHAQGVLPVIGRNAEIKLYQNACCL